MNRGVEITSSGSGPTTARGRFALRRLLEPGLAGWCESLGLGVFRSSQRIESGTHHIVWRVTTDAGEFAMRPAWAPTRISIRNHQRREQVWRHAAAAGVAPLYIGSCPSGRSEYPGLIEAFAWQQGRRLRPRADYRAVAQALAALHAGPRPPSRSKAVEPVSFIRFGLKRYAQTARRGGASSALLNSATMDALASLRGVKAWTADYRLVHNDLVDGNVIVRKNRAYLIDWDWALVTTPWIDLFNFLSPFVRAWGQEPVQLGATVSRRFLECYFIERGTSGTRKQAGNALELWMPYNVLLANWLAYDAPALAHTRRAEFYRTALGNVSALAKVLSGLK